MHTVHPDINGKSSSVEHTDVPWPARLLHSEHSLVQCSSEYRMQETHGVTATLYDRLCLSFEASGGRGTVIERADVQSLRLQGTLTVVFCDPTYRRVSPTMHRLRRVYRLDQYRCNLRQVTTHQSFHVST